MQVLLPLFAYHSLLSPCVTPTPLASHTHRWLWCNGNVDWSGRPPGCRALALAVILLSSHL